LTLSLARDSAGFNHGDSTFSDATSTGVGFSDCGAMVVDQRTSANKNPFLAFQKGVKRTGKKF
jgi:hypothetical protein